MATAVNPEYSAPQQTTWGEALQLAWSDPEGDWFSRMVTRRFIQWAILIAPINDLAALHTVGLAFFDDWMILPGAIMYAWKVVRYHNQ